MLQLDTYYKTIAEEIKNPKTEILYLNKQVVLNHMITSLPVTPWTNIEIIDWLPKDDALLIEYFFYNTNFGAVLAANTTKGICYLGLVQNDPEKVLTDLNNRFKHTELVKKETALQQQVIRFLDGNRRVCIPFHLKGSAYQTEIWRKLIRIPYGKVISYATLGGSPNCARAAGTANSRNPIFWVIPCHRVVKTTGSFDHYFWGKDIKRCLLAWEFSHTPDL